MRNLVALHDAGWENTHDRATLYDDPTTADRQRKLAQYLKRLPAGSRVLDHGCGRGEFTQFLGSLGFQAVGLDISGSAIVYNRRDFPGLEFVQAEADAPAPFPAGSFDALWSSEVVEHVYDVQGIFAEFARLLRPGGLLVLTTPYHGWLKNLLVITLDFDRHFNVEGQHIRFWSKRSLTRVAERNHLRPIIWDTVGRLPWIARSFFVVFERLPS